MTPGAPPRPRATPCYVRHGPGRAMRAAPRRREGASAPLRSCACIKKADAAGRLRWPCVAISSAALRCTDPEREPGGGRGSGGGAHTRAHDRACLGPCAKGLPADHTHCWVFLLGAGQSYNPPPQPNICVEGAGQTMATAPSSKRHPHLQFWGRRRTPLSLRLVTVGVSMLREERRRSLCFAPLLRFGVNREGPRAGPAGRPSEPSIHRRRRHRTAAERGALAAMTPRHDFPVRAGGHRPFPAQQWVHAKLTGAHRRRAPAVGRLPTASVLPPAHRRTRQPALTRGTRSSAVAGAAAATTDVRPN